MNTFVVHRAHRDLDSAQDKRAGANEHATGEDRQACTGQSHSQSAQTCEPDDQEAEDTAAELELMQAMQAYKQSSGRMFPTWSEVLEVLRRLGYEKPPRDAPRRIGRSLGELHARPLEILERPGHPVPINDANIDDAIEGWVRVLSLRDRETEEHTRRVTDMTLKLARAMHVESTDIIQIRRGALLHDIGKLGIPDAILHKPGPLSDKEREVMRRHPTYAYEWLVPIPALRPALEIPYCHHERWDGTGYPRGLKGEQIPLAARIFAIVDIWDALRSDRPYRGAWPREDVRHHIRTLTGTHLDPEVVKVFFRMLGDDIVSNLATTPAMFAKAHNQRTRQSMHGRGSRFRSGGRRNRAGNKGRSSLECTAGTRFMAV